MKKISDMRLSKSMKYAALYWAMRFYEVKLNQFKKKYHDGTIIRINSNNQEVFINSKYYFSLDSHESFVKLEFINRILDLKYCLSDLSFNAGKIKFRNFLFSFLLWDDSFARTNKNYYVQYKSRLVSGVIEYKNNIHYQNKDYLYGLVEKNEKVLHLSNPKKTKICDKNFIIQENELIKYIGNNRKVIVPEGITAMAPCAFWDNQAIEEVILPNSLINMGGDTFYNCRNLKKLTIPKNVKTMGNNPFAGCPKLVIKNLSPDFILNDGVLYDKDKTIIYYSAIKHNSKTLSIPNTVEIISKHAFYLNNRFKTIALPKSIVKIENNPFSGCENLKLINKSKNLYIKDGVIYNKWKTSVLGVLNGTKSKCLKLLPTTQTINRNSFWNCKGIKKIILPKSLVDIGYNPFVGCSNIKFESLSPMFKVVDGVLYNKDQSKIICYPSWKAIGDISLPETVIALERGAFSGCDKMTSINLHNVNIINKSCFTNCARLSSIYLSDLIVYVGEWAFAYCKSLKTISINKETIVDNNALSNTKAKLVYRAKPSNYLIESDNIYTLDSMQEKYAGKIDSILIDPPYNSNISYIGYKDSNYDMGYINFMKERLVLAHKLLSNKGWLILNIDDGELKSLVKLLTSIFGKDNVFTAKWKKKHPFFDANRVVLNPNKVQTDFENIIICKKCINNKLNKIMQPFIKNGKLFEKQSSFPKVFDCFGTTSSAKDEINEIFGKREYFSTPKPVKLIKEFARATTNKSSIILDFFAGSGTTGQAIWELNKEDSGSRTFILISNSESDICKKVTYKRLVKKNIQFKYIK